MPSSESRNETRQPALEQPTGDFAAYLRQARERRGISLRQIAATTKISLMALEALERGEVTKLPGGIFTRGFVRAYAREVGLEPERAVREFLARYPEQAPDDESLAPSRPIDEPAFDETPRWYGGALRLLGVVVPVALVVVYFAFGGRLWRSGPATPMPPPVGGPPVETRAVPPRADRTAVTPPATPAATGSDAIQIPPGVMPLDATRAAGDRPETRLVIRLAPTEECWVWLRVDGGESEQQLMRAGEAREVRARDVIVMTLGNAGAMVYSVNGQPGRMLGAVGAVVKDIRFTPENVRTFLSVPRRP